jgi:hypothetical protein
VGTYGRREVGSRHQTGPNLRVIDSLLSMLPGKLAGFGLGLFGHVLQKPGVPLESLAHVRPTGDRAFTELVYHHLEPRLGAMESLVALTVSSFRRRTCFA